MYRIAIIHTTDVNHITGYANQATIKMEVDSAKDDNDATTNDDKLRATKMWLNENQP